VTTKRVYGGGKRKNAPFKCVVSMDATPAVVNLLKRRHASVLHPPFHGGRVGVEALRCSDTPSDTVGRKLRRGECKSRLLLRRLGPDGVEPLRIETCTNGRLQQPARAKRQHQRVHFLPIQKRCCDDYMKFP
jgi:hypothetical protein